MGDDRTDWVHLFFSSAGRIERRRFLFCILLLLAVLALHQLALWGLARRLTAWAVHGTLLVSGACLVSKRLHDRGRSGWWAGLVLWAFAAVWPWPSGFFDFLFALVLAWAGVELGAMPGEQGANRFGPRPGEPPSAR